MRVLYGVAGEGMGHATRSEVVIGALQEAHDVAVVASGAAFRHLRTRLPKVDEVFGLTFALGGEGEIRRWDTALQNVRLARRDLPDTLRVWLDDVRAWRPDVVITDFEPLAGLYARLTRTPLVAVDNIHALDRCRHPPDLLAADHDDFLLARTVVRSMVPGAVEYVVTTFFDAPPAKRRTTLVPPILRPEIVRARPRRGEHLVVYSSGDPALLHALRATGLPCLVYGMRGGPDAARTDGNLEFRPPSNAGFVKALRTARGVVAGGGFSLIGEAVYLGKPILAIPLRGQFEQALNARYVARLGYGLCAPEPTHAVLNEFVGRLPEFEAALASYEQVGNAVALRTIEERAAAAAEAAPKEIRQFKRRARRPVPPSRPAGPAEHRGRRT